MVRTHWTTEEFWIMFEPLCRLAKDISNDGEIEAAMIEDAVKVWLIFTPVAGYA